MRDCGMYVERLHATEIGLFALQEVNHVLCVDFAHQVELLYTELETMNSEVLCKHLLLCCYHGWIANYFSFCVTTL